MALHNLIFFGGKFAGLFKYRIGNTDFADIVQHGGNFESIAEFFPLMPVNVMIKCPTVVNFHCIVGNAMHMQSRFARIV